MLSKTKYEVPRIVSIFFFGSFVRPFSTNPYEINSSNSLTILCIHRRLKVNQLRERSSLDNRVYARARKPWTELCAGPAQFRTYQQQRQPKTWTSEITPTREILYAAERHIAGPKQSAAVYYRRTHHSDLRIRNAVVHQKNSRNCQNPANAGLAVEPDAIGEEMSAAGKIRTNEKK